MLKSKTTSIIFLLFSICVSSCEEEESPDLPDLKVYLDRFEQEARERGYDLDLSGVEAVYVDEIKLEDEWPCGLGYSNYDGKGLRRIEISKKCWAGYTDIDRERIFFHEIGHAFLNRPHDDTKLCDGSYLTLMATELEKDKLYTEADGEKRDYYISELLDRMAAQEKCIEPEKDWSTDSVFYQIYDQDKDWFFHSENGNYTGERSAVTSTNDDFLSIAADSENQAEGTGYWFRTLITPNIPECSEVRLRVKMNSSELSGSGAAIAIRAYDAPVQKGGAQLEEYLFLTTENRSVSGQLIDHTEELVIPCFSRKTIHLVIFAVMMPGTEGEVTFEDIQLVVKEK